MIEMKANSHSLHLLAALFSSCAFLTACGGGSSQEDPTADTESAEGRVADSTAPTTTLWTSAATTASSSVVLGGTSKDNRVVYRILWSNAVNCQSISAGEALGGGTKATMDWS